MMQDKGQSNQLLQIDASDLSSIIFHYITIPKQENPMSSSNKNNQMSGP